MRHCFSRMARMQREGLRVRPVLPVAACEREKEERRKEQKRAACKRWREAVKLDPIRHEELKQKDKERNRANRHRSKTEDEKARERELTRQRVARLRAKRKAEKEAEVLVMTVQPVPRTTRAKEKKDTEVVRLQREKWAAYKRKERENWTSQRWRRHREKNLRAYHSRKETEKGEPPVQPDTSASHSERCPKSPPNPPYPTKNALRKAKYRIKKVLQAVGSRMQSMNYFKLVEHKDKIQETPDSKRIKNNVQEKLNSLKRKRDKKSIAKRRLFLQTVEEGLVSPVTSPYKRKKEHKGTEAIKKFMEEQACHIPGKKNTTKNNKQKKILQKRLKHLHCDFRITYPETPVSLRGMY